MGLKCSQNLEIFPKFGVQFFVPHTLIFSERKLWCRQQVINFCIRDAKKQQSITLERIGFHLVCRSLFADTNMMRKSPTKPFEFKKKNHQFCGNIRCIYQNSKLERQLILWSLLTMMNSFSNNLFTIYQSITINFTYYMSIYKCSQICTNT